jgi:N-acetylglucosaminyldiphosphoundecaprenol N-acetyl-beta-D-mannosaminyltransferase
MRVDATSYRDAADRICSWAHVGDSRYVCVATVNNVINARDDPGYRSVMRAADLVTPDGMPLVWGLRMLGVHDASRVYGPDLTRVICARAAQENIPVGFYGGTPEVLEDLIAGLRPRAGGLRVVYRASPPFRTLSALEERAVSTDIQRSGARILFVGLGTPKQEAWMARHKGEVSAVMIGVGAAFDFLSGRKRQAPPWMQELGMEWLFRLATEPKRLWRRYLYGNPRFLALFAAQLARDRWVSRASATQRR